MTIISPQGMDTPFGNQPRANDYPVTYIFSVGRYDIDKTRAYMPFDAAQSFFDREAGADEIEVMVEHPDRVEEIEPALAEAAGPRAMLWTWRDASGAFLSALDTERRVMFIILSMVVLIAALNIISGLVMLVKNKGRDIGILRTVGLSQGAIMRVFFICGSLIGVAGTLLGVVLGCLFVVFIHDIQARRRMDLRRLGLEPRDPLPDRDPRPPARRRRPDRHRPLAAPLLRDHPRARAQRRPAQPGRGAAL